MHRILFRILISIILLSFGVPAVSQTVTNVRAIQLGNDIEVSYVLDKPATNVQLCVSTDGGKTFSAPLRMVSGAVGAVSSGYHTILWDVFSEYGSLVGEEIVFKVMVGQKNKVKTEPSTSHKAVKTNFLIEANLAPLPQMSWGVTVGFVKKVGLYANFLLSMGYQNQGVGYAGNDVYFEGKPYSNEILIKNRFAVVGGGMFNIADLIYPRIGIGYGERYACYKDLDKNYDISGVSLDAGLTLKLGSVALSAGVLTTAFETTDMVLGIGFMF